MGLWRGRFRHGHRRERYWTRRPKLTVSILPPPSRQQRAANVVSPRCGCHLTVADKALLHNAQFVIIRPRPAAFTIGSRQNFDLRAVDKVGHKGGLTIGANTSSDGRPRRLTAVLEAEAVVSGLEDVATMGQPIEECGGHLGLTEHCGPLAEAYPSGFPALTGRWSAC